MAAGLIVAVLAVAYGTAAPSLGVAEFSPAARQALEAPPTTAGESAVQAGRQGGRRPTTTTTAAVEATTTPSGPDAAAVSTTRVGRARPCYGDPPRQLPDPRSPACIPVVFEGDNGGATGRGVTGTSIRVAVVSGGADHEAGVRTLFEYINRHYEFYGRRIEPVFVQNPASPDPAGQRAFADDVAAQGVFGLLTKPLNSRWTPSLFTGLARHGVVAVVDGVVAPASDRDLLDPLHPYVWSIYPSLEQQQRNEASFVCTALAGRPPTHAPELPQTAPRKFGVLAIGNYLAPRTRELVDGLDECGVTPAVAEVVNTTDGSTGLRNGLLRLQSAGVTTLLCACGDYSNGTVVSGLSGISWTPEFLTPTGITSAIEESDMRSRAPQLQGRLFGIQPYPKVVPPQAQRWFAAALEVQPATNFAAASYYMVNDYEQLLVLAAGIQAAGPQLTAETFGQGLMSSPFANSDAGQAPDYMPSVGFGPGDHSFYNDYALVWWGKTAEPYGWNTAPGVQGSWCYLDHGARYTAGRFPADADSRFFAANESCR